MDSSFSKVPVQVPRSSGFDKSHQNILTTKVGTITPILCDVLIPGSKVNLNLALSGQLPPLASDTFMRCSIKTEAFFVPFRLLCGSFESWFTNEPKTFAAGDSDIELKGYLPTFGLFSADTPGANEGDDPVLGDCSLLAPYFASGQLSDYLGMRTIDPTILQSKDFSLMPFLAYHKIYQDWYRNTLVQKDVFVPHNIITDTTLTGEQRIETVPYDFLSVLEGSPFYVYDQAANLLLHDGVSVFALRQRNFGLDYFTSSTPTAQQGSATIVASGESFTIAALRAANSLQQFKERNNLAGNLYVDQLYARYGVRPSDGIAQRTLFLGSQNFEVYSKGIYEAASSSASNNNPFAGQVGAQYGHAVASGSGNLVSDFEAKEPGFLFVNATLVPRVTYSSGIDRKFINFVGDGSISDLANPILQNVGPQPIAISELTGSQNFGAFGYTDRYAEYKTMSDSLHGLVRDGEDLEAFALQRSFDILDSPYLNSSFLEIPTDYLDQVLAVTDSEAGFSVWMDCFFQYYVSQPLAKYSLPTLQDPAYEHGRKVVVNRSGSKL